MSEQTDPVSNGGRDAPPHFLWPSFGKVGCALLLFVGIPVVLLVTTTILFGCGTDSLMCFLLGLYFVQLSVDATGGWPWGVLNMCVIILALSYLLACLRAWLRARPPDGSPR
jgi:hypothetical protein